jgi:hypothetical protein
VLVRNRCRIAPTRRWLIATLAVAAIAFVPSSAHARIDALTANLESPGFAEFSQTNVEQGSLVTTGARAYDGRKSARATYRGAGINGFARGLRNVNWGDGETVTYGAAFFLPRGFHSRVQGAVSLVRWDNWPSHGKAGDVGGLVLWGSDHKVHLIRGGYVRGYEGDLIRPFRIPEGRWVHLEVRQQLSGGSGARSEVYLDGRRVGVSTAPNAYGRPVERIRYGVVSVAEGAQVKPLTLYFDRATIDTRLKGPLLRTSGR